ncbi:hypothetical protein [Brevundimonas sp.]|uniref:hypothetical protein n=1 Tax=Brevundimonas sp. TaxID=1871086 RepID=UPI002FCB6A04
MTAETIPGAPAATASRPPVEAVDPDHPDHPDRVLRRHGIDRRRGLRRAAATGQGAAHA